MNKKEVEALIDERLREFAYRHGLMQVGVSKANEHACCGFSDVAVDVIGEFRSLYEHFGIEKRHTPAKTVFVKKGIE